MKAASSVRGLVEARIAAGLTQAHLAEASGISIRTVKRAESGLSVSAESVMALKAVLGDFDAKPEQPQKPPQVIVRRASVFDGVFGLRRVQRRALRMIPLHQVTCLLVAALTSLFDGQLRWIGLGLLAASFCYYALFVLIGMLKTPYFWTQTMLLEFVVGVALLPMFVMDKVAKSGEHLSTFQGLWLLATVISFAYFAVIIIREMDRGLMYMYMRPDGRIRARHSPMFGS
jgi:transcriptional regulator with XRE-family HTH domain